MKVNRKDRGQIHGYWPNAGAAEIAAAINSLVVTTPAETDTASTKAVRAVQ